MFGLQCYTSKSGRLVFNPRWTSTPFIFIARQHKTLTRTIDIAIKLSLCASVCLSHSAVLCRNGSTHHHILSSACDCSIISFPTIKHICEIPTGSFLRGVEYRWGYINLAIFCQICRKRASQMFPPREILFLVKNYPCVIFCAHTRERAVSDS